MKIIFNILSILCLSLTAFSQESYTGKKGVRVFPGHLHVAISVDSTVIHYQLFNHWYNESYAQERDIVIPFSELQKYESQNDTLTIIVLNDKVKLIDKRYKLNRKVKHQKLCVSIDTMRKISYANSVADKHKSIRHFDLFEQDDLKLTEQEFKKVVDKNIEEKRK
jgi:hypothetical protein